MMRVDEINLLPKEYIQFNKNKKIYFIWLVIVLLTVSGLIFLNIYLNKKIFNLETKLKGLKSEIQAEDSEILELGFTDEQINDFLKQADVYTKLKKERIKFPGLFEELEKNIPIGVDLVSVDYYKDNLTIKGKAKSNIDVSKFLTRLKEIKHYHTASASISSKEENDIQYLIFNIVLNWKGAESD